MKQYAKVAYLLRDLVKQDGHRGRKTDLHTDQIRSADQYPVHQVVQSIRDQIHVADGVYVIVGFKGMLIQ